MHNGTAQKVFMVLGSQGSESISISLLLDGKKLKTLVVNRHALYELLDRHTAGNWILEIQVNQPGLEAYTFTFA